MVRPSFRFLRNPHFWWITMVFLLCVVLHYGGHLPFLPSIEPFPGLQRHAIGRMLFLVPVTYAAFTFGIRGGIITLVAATAFMLPRVFLISRYPMDALFETGTATAIGILINWWLEQRRRELGRRQQALLKLEAARRELQSYIQVVRENERRISALHSISAAMNQSLVLEEVLDVAADKIKEAMDIDAVLVFFLDEETEELKLRAHKGISEEFAAEVGRLEIGKEFNGRVAQTAQPYLIEVGEQDPRISQEAMRTEGIESLFVVPLKYKNKVIGTLWVVSRGRRQFTSAEKELSALIGTELGVAIEKALLFQELQDIGERFQEIFEKAHDAIWIQDPTGQIVAANQAASKLTGYELAELIGRDVSPFFTPQGLRLAEEVEQNLLSGKDMKQPYEQSIVRKDGTEATLRTTTSLLGEEKTRAFLHIARDITDERRLQESLRLYADQISRAHEEERKRIARELHDDTIQTMVAISRRLDNFISRNQTIPKGAAEPLEKLQKEIDDSLVRIRRFVQDLRPPTLEYLGLLPALRELASQVQDQSGIEINLEVAGKEQHFAPEEGLLIYRVVQEAMRNVWKHSGATRAEIDVRFDKGRFTVVITDSGEGFEVKGSSELLEAGKLGLSGMKERAHLLGGTLDITSTPNKGTTVTLSIPKRSLVCSSLDGHRNE